MRSLAAFTQLYFDVHSRCLGCFSTWVSIAITVYFFFSSFSHKRTKGNILSCLTQALWVTKPLFSHFKELVQAKMKDNCCLFLVAYRRRSFLYQKRWIKEVTVHGPISGLGSSVLSTLWMLRLLHPYGYQNMNCTALKMPNGATCPF